MLVKAHRNTLLSMSCKAGTVKWLETLNITCPKWKLTEKIIIQIKESVLSRCMLFPKYIFPHPPVFCRPANFEILGCFVYHFWHPFCSFYWNGYLITMLRYQQQFFLRLVRLFYSQTIISYFYLITCLLPANCHVLIYLSIHGCCIRKITLCSRGPENSLRCHWPWLKG